MKGDEIKLTHLSSAAGCAAKLKATELLEVLSTLSHTECKNLLVGYDGNEDALVYKIDDETSLVSTVDFFPPMVDDPFTFGKIAAANALSDVYAMGGTPLYALSLLCFPQKLPKTILRDILEGGIEKAREAGIPIAGGHTIDDAVIKYGLAVTGKVATRSFWHNNTPRLGDALVLTKPLGVGIINTAVKCEEASREAAEKAIKSMETLNKQAAENAHKFEIHAATDVTGFGLLGHLMEMLTSSGLSAVLDSASIPYFKEAYEYAELGLLPAGLYNNREYTAGKVSVAKDVPLPLSDLLYDPQTSGGLLLSLPKRDAVAYTREQGGAIIIGEVTPGTQTALISVV